MKIIMDWTTGSVTDFQAKPRREGMLLVGTDGKIRFDHENGYTIYDSCAGGYTLPVGGIPLTDLAIQVQNLLGLAGSALQSFTETDPTVPAWAKNASKPTYTASEVGDAKVKSLHSFVSFVPLW